MAKRTYQRKEVAPVIPNSPTTLPITEPIAVYYRQSSEAQIGNISTTIQTVDMVAHLQRLGWQEDTIWMIDSDGGISGQTKIDERPGMSELFQHILDGNIRAVACQDEDRLFRDVTQIQVNIFIDACKTANVVVITPSMVYDFAHPTQGAHYARQFRFKCEMAAEYITSFIKGRLLPAKWRLHMEGKWAGTTIPVGYMVDMRELLPDGTRNPNERRFVPYEPFAEIVRAYFSTFVQQGGNINATMRHIIEHGPFFPDPTTWTIPNGFRMVVNKRMQNYRNGFTPSELGITNMFTNATYIGHWLSHGAIIHWNNHTPIVPVDTFMRAFNYLSPATLEGEPNPEYRKVVQQRRPSLESERTVPPPLLSGMIFTPIKGTLKRAGSQFNKSWNRYCYLVTDTSDDPVVGKHLWCKKAERIDEVVSAMLCEKLKSTFSPSTWQDNLGKYRTDLNKERDTRHKQLILVERSMNNLVASLDTLTNPMMIQKAQERYEAAQQELTRLTSLQTATDTDLAKLEAIEQLRQNYGLVIDEWNNYSEDRKREVLHAFIDKVVIEPLPKAAVHLVIHWRDFSTDSIDVATKAETYLGWLEVDEELLFTLVDKGASQEEIASAFPDRNWKTIRQKVYSVRGKGSLQVTPKPIDDGETYLEYQARTQDQVVQYKARHSERWLPEDIERLCTLLDSNCTQLELMAAFPHRRWEALRNKVTELRGAKVRVRGMGKGEVKRPETYRMYQLRKQYEDGVNAHEDVSSQYHPNRSFRGWHG